MMNRSATRLAAVLLPAVLLAPTAAHAERAVVRDATADVARFDLAASQAAGREVVVPAPRERSVDIRSVVVHHREDLVRLTIEVRRLGSTSLIGAHVELRSQRRLWGIRVARWGPETRTTLTRGHRETQRDCDGLVSTVDEDAEAIVVSVPTPCIEDPRWVRIGVMLITEKVERGGKERVSYLDEAGVTGFEDDHLEVRGPKIHRG